MKLVLFPCSVPFLLFCNTVIKILIDLIILERIAGVFPTPIWCSSEPDPVMVCYVSMCGSRGTCPFLVLIQGCRRRSPAAHHNPAHHSPAHYSPSHPNPSQPTPLLFAVLTIPSNIVGHSAFPSILGRASGDISP